MTVLPTINGAQLLSEAGAGDFTFGLHAVHEVAGEGVAVGDIEHAADHDDVTAQIGGMMEFTRFFFFDGAHMAGREFAAEA